MSQDIFSKFTAFLNNLEQANIHYTIAHHRDDALMVLIAVPGERWEVEFLTDGSIEVERFLSDGEIGDETMLAELFAQHSDADERSTAVSPTVEMASVT